MNSAFTLVAFGVAVPDGVAVGVGFSNGVVVCVVFQGYKADVVTALFYDTAQVVVDGFRYYLTLVGGITRVADFVVCGGDCLGKRINYLYRTPEFVIFGYGYGRFQAGWCGCRFGRACGSGSSQLLLSQALAGCMRLSKIWL